MSVDWHEHGESTAYILSEDVPNTFAIAKWANKAHQRVRSPISVLEWKETACSLWADRWLISVCMYTLSSLLFLRPFACVCRHGYFQEGLPEVVQECIGSAHQQVLNGRGRGSSSSALQNCQWVVNEYLMQSLQCITAHKCSFSKVTWSNFSEDMCLSMVGIPACPYEKSVLPIWSVPSLKA